MSRVKNFYHDEICAQPEQDEPDVEVCANCGAYYDGRFGGKWQRCGPCRVGLEWNRDSDTHPKDGDVEHAPLVSGAVAKPIAQSDAP